jgi:glutaredoxin
VTEARRQIILYGKPECPLCDEAREVLEGFAADPDHFLAFDLDEVDIRRDPANFAAYRYRIPVVTIDGVIAAEGNMHDGGTDALAHALARPAGGQS